MKILSTLIGLFRRGDKTKATTHHSPFTERELSDAYEALHLEVMHDIQKTTHSPSELNNESKAENELVKNKLKKHFSPNIRSDISSNSQDTV
ncbi:hypothetical protein [Pontibacter sp. SGAir0037]|uniref:hypothetical protein n=1 Tax=Pontibacter sp. SGAir0037 TaxID=2571030 RepID=UPI0010F6E2D3|nr:hypothetical protein [Pontibacter sp. SGAir0037]